MIKIGIDNEKMIRKNLMDLSKNMMEYMQEKFGLKNIYVNLTYYKKKIGLTIVLNHLPTSNSYEPTWSYEIYVAKRTEYYSEKDECLYGIFELDRIIPTYNNKMITKGTSFTDFIKKEKFELLLEEIVYKFNKNI